MKKLGYMKTNIYLCTNQLNICVMGIELWDAETIEKMFDYMLDEMSEYDRNIAISKYVTIKEKKAFMISQEKKFEKSFK